MTLILSFRTLKPLKLKFLFQRSLLFNIFKVDLFYFIKFLRGIMKKQKYLEPVWERESGSQPGEYAWTLVCSSWGWLARGCKLVESWHGEVPLCQTNCAQFHHLFIMTPLLRENVLPIKTSSLFFQNGLSLRVNQNNKRFVKLTPQGRQFALHSSQGLNGRRQDLLPHGIHVVWNDAVLVDSTK